MNQVVLKPHNFLALKILANDQVQPETEDLWTAGYAADPFPDEILELLENGTRYSKKISLAECGKRNDRLTFRERLYVPNFEPLRLQLLKSHHDNPAAGHPGRAKTLDLLTRGYFWPTMRKDVDRYVANCHTCQRNRTPRHKPYGCLKPLPVPHKPWQDISMDFVTGLPWSDGFDAIYVVVDRLTKMRHFVPCRQTTSAQDLADLFLQGIFRLHGLPKSIVSDRGPQFVAAFWKRMCERLGIERKLSTAYHPETDGQTERVNAVMEQYLRSYVNYQQDDWNQWLALAEFATNNHVSEITNVSPFFANYGFDPRLELDNEKPPQGQPDIDAQGMVQTMDDIFDHLRTEMARAQLVQAEYADQRRNPAPSFKEGDSVWLNTRNIRTRRPSRKLDHRKIGPFKVLEKIGSHAYRLELPETVRIHNVFHVSLLSLANEDPYPGQHLPPPPPIEIDGEEEYEVDEILDSKRVCGRLRYLIKRTGYNEPTWEPAQNTNDLRAVDEFHARYPDKPGPDD
jgi:transposase InsO family protein